MARMFDKLGGVKIGKKLQGPPLAQWLWERASEAVDGWAGNDLALLLTCTIRTGIVKLQWRAKDYRHPEPGYILASDMRRVEPDELINYNPTKTLEARQAYPNTLIWWKDQALTEGSSTLRA